ncbi:MAG: hypothetical protein M0Z66_12090 [Thermaerobacter sp.]|nr:hypothetical protein [Thermaerobacter sp.]
MTSEELYDRLTPIYPADGWWPSDSPFETAVGAVLVQGVSWRNAAQAVARLKERGLLDPQVLAQAPAEEVADAVRPALYHHQKSSYLQALALFLRRVNGMDALRALPRAKQRAALLSVRGIGEETAAAIMVYALGGAEPVVDAYARRLFLRTGAVGAASDEAVALAMRRVIRGNASRARALHAAVVEHARTICRKSPRCSDCPIAINCPRILGETCAGRWRNGRRAGSAAQQVEIADRVGTPDAPFEGAGGPRTGSMG